ncbi:MAG: hypothetical protein M1353_07910 [Nitrospirae bacterium]|nr:hypothetical protein [Nitrospirota bacterium]
MKVRIVFTEKGPATQFLNDIDMVIFQAGVTDVYIEDVSLELTDIIIEGQKYKSVDIASRELKAWPRSR